MVVGTTTGFMAVTSDASGNPLSGRRVTWSSGMLTVATVDQNGTVTAVAAGGPVPITATSEGVTGSAFVTVLPQVANIAGTVSDRFGGRISGATVVLRQNGVTTFTTTTNSSGQFSRTGVPVGSYEVVASKSGFITSTVPIVVSAPNGATVTVSLNPEALPSSGAVSTRTLGVAGQRYTFEVDLFVVDQNSQSIGLAPSAFSITSFTSGTTQFSFAQNATTTVNATAAGPYSAALLLDQSGSITGTDPNNSRLQAAKIFLNALGTGDEVTLSAFAGSGRLIPFELTVYGGGFTANGPSYFPTLDALANQVGGGTPLYRSTLSMVNYTSTNARNTNRAVVVFTDGDDTEGGASISQIGTQSLATGVKVYTVALGSVNTSVLAEMARRGNGTMMWASDARQLVSLYGTLGRLLRGSIQLYRTNWTMTASSGNWASMSTSVRIQTPSGTLSAPFHVNFVGGIPDSGVPEGGRIVDPAMTRGRVVVPEGR